MKDYQKEAEKIFMNVLQDPYYFQYSHDSLADNLEKIFNEKTAIEIYYPLSNLNGDIARIQRLYIADIRKTKQRYFISANVASEVCWINCFDLYDFVGKQNLIYIENDFALNAKNCINFL